MTTWIIDLQDKVGQRVLPTADIPGERRFRKVQAESFTEALDKAHREEMTLKKLDRIVDGHAVIMSDAELNWVIDQGLHPTDVVSVPNPNRCGITDAYVVGQVTCPVIKAFRVRNGMEENTTRAIAP